MSGISTEPGKYSLQTLIVKKCEIKDQEAKGMCLFEFLIGLRLYAYYLFVFMFWVMALDTKIRIPFGVATIALYFGCQYLGVKIFSIKSVKFKLQLYVAGCSSGLGALILAFDIVGKSR